MKLKPNMFGFDESDFLQLNIHDCPIKLVNKYTPATNRPDLVLASGAIIKSVPFWTVQEQDNASDWKHEDFIYELSTLGFRDRDLNESSPHVNLAAFGCSNTFGIGLPLNKLWHKLLADKYGLSSYNFGIPGSSIKSACDVFAIVSRHIRIDKAIFLMPTIYRQLCAVTNLQNKNIKMVNVLPNHNSLINKTSYDLDQEMYLKYIPEIEFIKRAKDDVYNLEYLAMSRNIQVFISSWDRTTHNLFKKMSFKHITVLPEWINPPDYKGKEDDARDGLHPGYKHNKYWMEQIASTVCK